MILIALVLMCYKMFIYSESPPADQKQRLPTHIGNVGVLSAKLPTTFLAQQNSIAKLFKAL